MTTMVKRVLLASPRGYCAGVERAVDTVEELLDSARAARLRSQADRPQRARRSRPRGPRRDFRRDEREVPEGQTVVLSAHGVAPVVYANAQRARAEHDRRHLPARDQGARPGAPVRGGRVHRPADRPRRSRGGRGHDGRGARVDDPRRSRSRTRRRSTFRRTRRSPTSRRRRCRSTRPARSSPRSGGGFRRSRAEEGRHLLRDLEPPVGGQGPARRGRPAARDRLAQLVELEPARRGRAGARRRRRS